MQGMEVPSKPRISRAQRFRECLDDNSRDNHDGESVRELKWLCAGGIPDVPHHLRPAAYRVLLELGSSSSLVSQYTTFVDEISSRIAALPAPLQDAPECKEDRLLREILRDVDRTFGGYDWYSGIPDPQTPIVVDAAEAVDKVEDVQEEDALWKRIRLLEEHDLEKARLSRKDLATSTPTTTGDPEDSSPPRSNSLDKLVESAAKSSSSPASLLVEGESSSSNPSSDDIAPPPTSPVVSSTTLPATAVSASPLRPKSRRQALLRPLFIYAMLNPGVAYVQGMNSVVGVFWWIFSHIESRESLMTSGSAGLSKIEAEASSFFAMGAILSQLRDLYVRSLDGTISPALLITSPSRGSSATAPAPIHLAPTGLAATLSRFTSLLTWLDPSLAAALASKGVDPAHYLFRWVTTLFSYEFIFPDLVKIWDRIFSFYPSTIASSATTEPEALSPILSHLLDISLAMVLMERPALASPYTSFDKCLKILQDPQIEGDGVDRLLDIAWEIRDRRLGRSNEAAARMNEENDRQLSDEKTGAAETWKIARSATLKWTKKAKVAAIKASTGSTANSLRSYWNPAIDEAEEAEEKEDGETAVGDDETLSHNSSSKSLPPPPSSSSAASTGPPLSEKKVPRIPVDSDDSISGSDSEEEDQPSLASRAAASWSSWSTRFAASDVAATLSKQTSNARAAATASASSFAQLGSSDAAAALSKRTTNLTAQAQLFRDQVVESAPQRIARLKEASGRFLASTGSEVTGPPRPGSPILQPFTPPSSKTTFSEKRNGGGGGDSPGMARRPVSPAPRLSSLVGGSSVDQALSPELKPMWLSTEKPPSSKRRGANGSESSDASGSSKRNSSAIPYNPLGALAFESPSRSSGSAQSAASEDGRQQSSSGEHSRTSSSSVGGSDDKESFRTSNQSPALERLDAHRMSSSTSTSSTATLVSPSKGSTRLIDALNSERSRPALPRQNSLPPATLSNQHRQLIDGSSPSTPTSIPSGRGFALSDGPVRHRPSSLYESTPSSTHTNTERNEGGGDEELEGGDTSLASSSLFANSSRPQRSRVVTKRQGPSTRHSQRSSISSTASGNAGEDADKTRESGSRRRSMMGQKGETSMMGDDEDEQDILDSYGA